MSAFIEINNLHYRPESLPAERSDILDGISMDIQEGEFVAVIGENGSGKTTLIKHINGLLIPTSGTVKISGIDTQEPKYHKKLRQMVGMVFQNPAEQIVASTVEEDIAFGLENLNLPTQEIRKRVADQLRLSDLQEEATRPPHLLSGGQIQKLALAGVLARSPRVILFDEPTSMLDPVIRTALLDRIRNLHKQGLTIVYITHHMEEAVYADKIIALQSGKIVKTGTPADIFSEQQTLYEIGLELPEAVTFAGQFRKLGWDVPPNTLTPDDLLQVLPLFKGELISSQISTVASHNENLIEISDAHYTYLDGTPLAKKAIAGASLDIQSQAIHGIAGANGSGKSTLLQHINGILRPSQGQVHVGDFHLEDPDTRLIDVIKQVGLVFQSPETQFFEVFVGDEIAYGPKQFEMDNLRDRVRTAMAMVGLDFEAFKDRRLDTLSGGEKRKVALASTLVLEQNILLFDEPTAGMDPKSREEIMHLFRSLSQSGKTIVIATHRIEELASITQNLSLMQFGKVIKTDVTAKLMPDQSTLQQAGLIIPLAVKLAKKLIGLGWPLGDIPPSTPDALIERLKEVHQ